MSAATEGMVIRVAKGMVIRVAEAMTIIALTNAEAMTVVESLVNTNAEAMTIIVKAMTNRDPMPEPC